MTREEVLRGLERIRDVGVVNHKADMQVIDGAIEIIMEVYEIIDGTQAGKYESDSHFGGVDNVSKGIESSRGKS